MLYGAALILASCKNLPTRSMVGTCVQTFCVDRKGWKKGDLGEQHFGLGK